MATIGSLLGASACTDGVPTVDDKLLGTLAASERGEVDRYRERLDIVSRYREQTKKNFERVQSEVELVEKAKASAESLLALRQARAAHAKQHVGSVSEAEAVAAEKVTQTHVETLGVAIEHLVLRRDYMESYDIAADDAVLLSKAELEKTKVEALAAAGKIDKAKLKVSEFDVAARAAKTRYAGHIEAAAKVRVALVKAKQAHDAARVKACTGAQGPTLVLLHCEDKNGAPWARTLPEAETLDRLQRDALEGKGVPRVEDEAVNPLSNDLEGEPNEPPPAAPPPAPPPASPPEGSVPAPAEAQ